MTMIRFLSTHCLSSTRELSAKPRKRGASLAFPLNTFRTTSVLLQQRKKPDLIFMNHRTTVTSSPLPLSQKGVFGTARQPTMSLNPCHLRHQRHQRIGHQEQWPYTTVPTNNANSLKTHRCTLHQTPSLLWSRPATRAQTNTILHSLTIKQILSTLLSLQATLKRIRLDPPFLSVINFKWMTNV